MQPEAPSPQLIRLINYGILASIIVAAVFIALNFTYYGTLQYTPKENERLLINGHPVTSRTTKLRPGTYTITLHSSRYDTIRKTVKVTAFKDTSFKPSYVDRDPNLIVSSQLGAYGYSGPPHVSGVKWFSDSWMACIVNGPADSAPIAMQYKDGKWHIAYFYNLNGDYPTDLTKLPADVASYIKHALNEVSQG